MHRKFPARELALIKRMARAHGGVLLSRACVGKTVKLRFRCARGHEWAHSPSKLEQGQWCPECLRADQYKEVLDRSFGRLRRLVADRGGSIVSTSYPGTLARLRFRCAKGHEWSTTPKSILRGTWCARCFHADGAEGVAQRKKDAIRRLRRIVKRCHGEILSPIVIDRKTKLRFRCERGHVWQALPQRVDEVRWCPECRRDSMLAELRELAQVRGGECLSRICRSAEDRLEWRCAAGHRFQAIAAWVRQGTWCSRCRWLPRSSIEHMQEVARERGGSCLSASYRNRAQYLRWRCGQGHVWKAHAGTIVQGSWCPICRRSRHRIRRLTIEDMRATAAERGGACLSARYHASDVPIRWRCARGHTWGARPAQIRQGHWCPVCSHLVPGTLDGMRALAAQHGGRCRTRTWNDHSQPVEFECDRGHRFSLLAVVAKTGVWCPVCTPRTGSRGRRAVPARAPAPATPTPIVATPRGAIHFPVLSGRAIRSRASKRRRATDDDHRSLSRPTRTPSPRS